MTSTKGEQKDPAKDAEDDVDIWRDTSLRYLGYANEVGESFRPVFPRFVVPSYALAFGYVGMDTATKVYNATQKGKDMKSVIHIGADCFLWQTLASVLIPGKVIYYVTAAATNVFHSDSPKVRWLIKRFPPLYTWGPTMVGLATIPFIVEPIDQAVHTLFDHTFRVWWWK